MMNRSNRKRTGDSRKKLRMESLEGRRVLATVTLNTDTGVAGELRTELANANSGDSIDFNLAAGNETINLTAGELLIDKELTIDGANTAGSGMAITIDAGSLSRVMTVDDSSAAFVDVRLSNLTITGGDSTGAADLDGGGILNRENMVLEDSTVTGNFAADSGGGIRSNAGALEITRSAVDGNQAEDRGGGLWVAYGTVSISDSTISGNTIDTAIGAGLGAGITARRSVDMTIENSLISNNYAKATYYDPVTMMTTNVGRGGGIYVSGVDLTTPTSLTITNSTLDGNSVFGMAGAIQSGIGVTLLIEDSTFTNNSATGDAGAIGTSSFSVADGATTTIRRSMISGNSSGDDGGAIESASGVTTLIDDSMIYDNYAFDRGGGVFVTGYYDAVNQPVPIPANMTITNSIIRDNLAIDDGGGVHAGEATSLVISNTEILNNRAETNAGDTSHGGGVRLSFANDAASDALIENSTVSGNFAGADGGGFYVGQSFDVRIVNTLIDGNSAGDDGGAGTFRTDTTVSVEDSTITNNYSFDNGGGFHVINASNTTITRSTISKNNANDAGGGVVGLAGSSTTIVRSTISENTAVSTGGGMDISAAGVTLVQSTVSGNESGAEGGGIYLRLDPTDPNIYAQVIEGSTITNNTVTTYGYGGGLYTDINSNATITGSIISGNSDTSGAPDVYDPYGNTSLAYTLIGDNSRAYISESPGDANGNIVGGPVGGTIDALLSPLQDNGGPTETHIPLVASPVIDRGDPALVPGVLTDQRGAERVVNGDAIPEARVDMGSVEFGASLLPDGDFDGNGVWECADIDALVMEIVAGTNNAAFDMNGDGVVDRTDINEPTVGWLRIAGEQNLGPGKTYLEGDGNLDGVVDVSDFSIWNASKFTTVAAWCSGDFSADGVVDVSDFAIWNANKFTASDASPSALALAVGARAGREFASRSAELLDEVEERGGDAESVVDAAFAEDDAQTRAMGWQLAGPVFELLPLSNLWGDDVEQHDLTDRIAELFAEET